MEDFMHHFLYGDGEPEVTAEGYRFSCVMTKKMEGWIDVPHGGFSMGLITDLALRGLSSPSPYPLTLSFRLGGSSLRIGDAVDFKLSFTGNQIEGVGTVHGQPFPYIEFTGLPGTGEHIDFTFPHFIPTEKAIPLPTYQDCLVCGTERKYPGLRRKFFFIEEISGMPVISPVSRQDEAFFLFSQEGKAHPLAILALLDEILGWAGFMLTASGAVTVSLRVVLYRPIKVGEELLFFGQGGRVRGKAGRRLMFWAKGATLADREPVAVAEGQYFGLDSLTQQMKENLLPRELTIRAFQSAVGVFP